MAGNPTVNNQGNIEWTENATSPDGDNVVIKLELDAIDSGSGFVRENKDSKDVSWLDFSKTSSVNPDGSRITSATIEVDPGAVSTGNKYRFEISADDNALKTKRLFLLQVAASKKIDGTRLFIMSENQGRIGDNELSSAWNITTASEVENTAVNLTRPHGLEFSLDGTKMFITETDDNNLVEYNLSNWNITSKSNVQSVNVGTEPNGISLKDGTKLFIVREAGYVDSYVLSSEYDISTLNSENTLDVTTEDTFMQDIAFKSDGGKMYLTGGANDRVFEYDLNTSWNISTVFFFFY